MNSSGDIEKINSDNMLAIAILDAREQRAELQQELIKKYKKTLISARVNYPGLYKDNDITRSIMQIISSKISSSFDGATAYKRMEYSIEGPYLIQIVNIEPLETKAITVEVENSHPLGRLVDIDVFNPNGTALSRIELGLDPRKCYLCSDMAHNCARSRKHSVDEIVRYIENEYIRYKEN
jgi:holo-ACP synthase